MSVKQWEARRGGLAVYSRPSGGSVMPSHSTHRRSAFALMVAGVGGSIWEWLDHGTLAAAEPGFYAGLTAALVGSLSWVLLSVVPPMIEVLQDLHRVYGAGVRDALGCADCPVWRDKAPEPERRRHLTSV